MSGHVDFNPDDQHIWQDDGTDALRFATASVPACKEVLEVNYNVIVK